MRHFRPEEQQFIRDISVKKQEGNLQDLQIFQLLRPKLSNIALRWSVEPKRNIQIYFPSGFASSFTNDIMKAYYAIADFIYFIEELESYNLIRIQNMSFSNRRLTILHSLYDNVTYDYDGSEDVFRYLDGGAVGLFHVRNKEVDNGFAIELEKYVNAYIFPLPALDEFIKYDFKDFEQRVFDENRISNKKALTYSRRAIYVSAFAVIFPALYSDTADHDDMANITSAILQKKTITIDSVTKHHLDTINVNITNKQQIQPIDLKVTVTPNQVNSQTK